MVIRWDRSFAPGRYAARNTETQLPLHPLIGRTRNTLGFAAVLLAGLAAPSLVVAANGMGTLPADAGALSSFSPLLPKADVGAPARIEVAQSQGEAQLNVRIQQLEEQIRNLTGQVEGLQFQLTQMQTLIERLNEDIDFRFQALEGGAGKKTEAATQADGVTPSGALPQDQSAPVAPAATDTPPATDESRSPTDTQAPAAAPADAGVLPPVGAVLPPVAADRTTGETAPMDDLGDSSDPLLGVGVGEESPLGTLTAEDLNGRPLDLSLSTAPAENGDAAAQYQAGYDAILRGDYAFAEDQFRQFVALYPQDPKAADGYNWLGDALLRRGAYDEAADVLLTGYQNYADSPARPDLLLKLGVALAGAGETATACKTFAEVSKRYPDQPAAFVMRLGEERAKAQCPA